MALCCCCCPCIPVPVFPCPCVPIPMSLCPPGPVPMSPWPWPCPSVPVFFCPCPHPHPYPCPRPCPHPAALAPQISLDEGPQLDPRQCAGPGSAVSPAVGQGMTQGNAGIWLDWETRGAPALVWLRDGDRGVVGRVGAHGLCFTCPWAMRTPRGPGEGAGSAPGGNRCPG